MKRGEGRKGGVGLCRAKTTALIISQQALAVSAGKRDGGINFEQDNNVSGCLLDVIQTFRQRVARTTVELDVVR